MTTIRKIVTSKIDGNDANVTDVNEIRPFGEIAVYLDTNPNPNRQVLMMFDGVRTHQKSKVLAPGELYGSNADSGDGGGLDTIKLIPDAALGTDQYIVVDPTGGDPGHIHLRAGGTQDASGADLYLGGELTNVRVSDSADSVSIRTSTVGEGVTPYLWSFESNGQLTYPDATATTGSTISPTIGNGYAITTQHFPSVSANAGITSGAGSFVADISENDDITVVETGWEINVGSVNAPILFSVTGVVVDPGVTCTITTSSELTFISGDSYTFYNPVPAASTWTFGESGILSTPGSGSISHRDNDLMLEANGLSDVIVLRTVGGELVLSANGDVLLSSNLVFANDVRITLGGAMDNNSLNFSVPDSLDPDTRHEFAFDASVGYPVLRFPDDSYQSTAWAGGRVVNAPYTSEGQSGDQERDIAFDNSYIYYCTADFTSHASPITVSSTEWGGASGGFTTLPFASERVPQIGWTIDITFNSGTVVLTITGVTAIDPPGSNRYQIDFTSVGSINVSNGNTGVLIDTLPVADIWKRVALSSDTW